MKGPIKRSSKPHQLGKKKPAKKKGKVTKVTYTKAQANEATLRNEKYAASRDYDFAEPRSGKQKMAKIRFANATRLLKKHRARKKK